MSRDSERAGWDVRPWYGRERLPSGANYLIGLSFGAMAWYALVQLIYWARSLA